MTNKAGVKTLGNWGKGAPRKLHESAFALAHRLNKKPWICDLCGAALGGKEEHYCTLANDESDISFHRRRIFTLSLGDWLDPEVPIEWLARTLDAIRQCDQVHWLMLTKRPELWRSRVEAVYNLKASLLPADVKGELLPHVQFCTWLGQWLGKHPKLLGNKPPANLWLGVSVENQEVAIERIPELSRIPAAVRFLSVEPLLGSVDLCFPMVRRSLPGQRNHADWVIIGGESGDGARPCNVEWIRTVKNQCKEAGVACFVKQLGANAYADFSVKSDHPVLAGMTGVENRRLNLKDKKGGDMKEWPEDLRVREFPKI